MLGMRQVPGAPAAEQGHVPVPLLPSGGSRQRADLPVLRDVHPPARGERPRETPGNPTGAFGKGKHPGRGLTGTDGATPQRPLFEAPVHADVGRAERRAGAESLRPARSNPAGRCLPPGVPARRKASAEASASRCVRGGEGLDGGYDGPDTFAARVVEGGHAGRPLRESRWSPVPRPPKAGRPPPAPAAAARRGRSGCRRRPAAPRRPPRSSSTSQTCRLAAPSAPGSRRSSSCASSKKRAARRRTRAGTRIARAGRRWRGNRRRCRPASLRSERGSVASFVHPCLPFICPNGRCPAAGAPPRSRAPPRQASISSKVL